MSEFYIVDCRPEWKHKPYITLWRPDNAGYAYPLPWAGKYSEEQVIGGGDYYTCKEYLGDGKWTRYYIRFAVPCDVVKRLACEPKQGDIDGNTGPVVPNTGKMRTLLRRNRYVLQHSDRASGELSFPDEPKAKEGNIKSPSPSPEAVTEAGQ